MGCRLPLLSLYLALTASGCARLTAEPRGAASDGAVADAPADIASADGAAFDGTASDGVTPEGPALTDGARFDLLPSLNLDPGPCSQSGWCWAFPQPTGDTLHAIWASGPSDVHAAGQAGTLMHYDGNSWEVLYAGRSETGWQTINALWGSGPTDVWGGGDGGLLLHFDGTQWSPMGSGVGARFTSIWGLSSSALFLATNGAIYRFDRNTAEPMAIDSDVTGIEGLWGLAEDQIWAVGRAGLIARYEGSRWSKVPHSLTNNHLYGIWGSSPTDLYAGGGSGALLHFDGTQWASLPARSNSVYAIWGRSATEVYIAQSDGIFRYDGNADHTLSASVGAEALHGDANGTLWAVGQAGRIHRGDASGLALQHGSETTLTAVWGRSASEIYIGGYNNVWRLESGALTPLFSVIFSPDALCGQGSDTLHALVTGRLYSYTGSGAATQSALPANSRDIWCGATHVYAGGFAAGSNVEGALHRFDGTSWETVCDKTTGPVDHLWGSSETDIYAVSAYAPEVLHYDGTSCSPVEIGTTQGVFGPVWGTSSSDVVVVTGTGTFRHFDGNVWRYELGPPFSVEAVGGASELIAVGASGRIMRRINGNWLEELTPTIHRLHGVWAGDGTTVALSSTGALIKR